MKNDMKMTFARKWTGWKRMAEFKEAELSDWKS